MQIGVREPTRKTHTSNTVSTVATTLEQTYRQILEKARGKHFRQFEQISILGWSEKDGTIEKGSMALISKLLKIIVIAWVKVLLRNQQFESGKVWKIFWSRARRQWFVRIRNGQGTRIPQHKAERKQCRIHTERNKCATETTRNHESRRTGDQHNTLAAELRAVNETQ